MEIESSSLYREITGIIESGQKPVHYTWLAQIHANGLTFPALKVLSIDSVCDYESKYADEIMLAVVIPAGTYARKIYPFQSNLEITLFRQPIGEASDAVNREETIQSERYTATLIDTGNPIIEANGSNQPTEETLNLTNLFEVQFQLVNKSLEQLRMISVGGVYRNCTVEDVIKGVMTKESLRVQVEGVRMPQGVDMIEATNKAKREHIVIPQGTKLVHVPDYIHRKCGGVYSAGMGYYLQGDYWYVYPCYDTVRFKNALRTMTIINVPPNKFPSIERTYRQNGSNVVVLATGEVTFRDSSEYHQLNHGNGLRFADASKFMENFSVTENNKTLISRGANNSEFVNTPRPNQNNNVHSSEHAINSNPYREYSKLAQRNGGFLSLVWENSNTSLIFPGMMVKVMYLEEDEIKEIEGVVLKVHHYTHMRGEGLTSTRYVTNSMLSIFVQRQPK